MITVFSLKKLNYVSHHYCDYAYYRIVHCYVKCHCSVCPNAKCHVVRSFQSNAIGAYIIKLITAVKSFMIQAPAEIFSQMLILHTAQLK